MARMFPSATDEYIRCYRLRDLLSLVGGYVFVGVVIIYLTTLPLCFSGGNFSLRHTLSRGQLRAKMARSAGRKQKKTRTHTNRRITETPKSERHCSLKKVISVPIYVSTSRKTQSLCSSKRKGRICAPGTYNRIQFV